MLKLGIDLDGVLANVHDQIRYRIKSDLGFEPDEFVDWAKDERLKKYGITSKWIYTTLFNDGWFWARIEPHLENIETLQKWATHCEIHIVTGRHKETCGMETLGWLRRYKVPFDKLTFEQVMHKVVYLNNNEIPVLFEDRFFEANKCAAFGIRSYLIKRQWNEKHLDKITNPLLIPIDYLADAENWVMDNI